MKATVVLDMYHAWLVKRKLVPTFHVNKALTCIRYSKPNEDPVRMVTNRKAGGGSRAFIHTMDLFEMFIVKSRVKKIENDIPSLGTVRKQFWNNASNKKRILKRYKDKKKEPPVSWKKIVSILPEFDKPVDAAAFALLSLQGFRKQDVLKLKGSEVDFVNNTLILEGKSVLLFKVTRKILLEYRKENPTTTKSFFGRNIFARRIDLLSKRVAIELDRNPQHLTSSFWRRNMIGIMWKQHGPDFTINQFNIKEMYEILPHVNKTFERPFNL
jgi:integrase